jgi:hypothetical protein
MPYKLRKAPKRDLYWVVGEDGKKHSKEPIPLERAKAQMRALYASMRRGGMTFTDFQNLVAIHNSIDGKTISAEDSITTLNILLELFTPGQTQTLKDNLTTDVNSNPISIYNAIQECLIYLTNNELDEPQLSSYLQRVAISIKELLFPDAARRRPAKVEHQVGRTQEGKKYSITHQRGKLPTIGNGSGKCRKCGLVRLV